MTRVLKLVFCIIFMLVLSGCGNKLAELKISGDTYLYIPSINARFETEMTAVPEMTDEPETIIVPETTVACERENVSEITTSDESIESAVYWVASGKVWHTREDCKSLSRSKNIKTGTVSDALSAGKERVCSVCGG